MVFPGVQKTTWTLDTEARAWYFHRFYDFQPDLNMDNPHVREEIQQIMGFWLQLGVSGFRLDAVPFVIEKPRPTGASRRSTSSTWTRCRDFLQWRVGDAVLLAEANVAAGRAHAVLRRAATGCT